MIFIAGLILVVQSFFYYLLKPFILISTPIFEFRNIWIILIFFFIWLISTDHN